MTKAAHILFNPEERCGCRLNISTKLPPITFCPLHAAAPKLLAALRCIAALWPEPPNCADVMAVSGINDGDRV